MGRFFVDGKREYTEITINILKETEENLREMAALSHSSTGHMIDRMAMNWVAKEPVIAANLILEDLLTHTVNFDLHETNQAIAIVLAIIRKSLDCNDPQALKIGLRT